MPALKSWILIIYLEENSSRQLSYVILEATLKYAQIFFIKNLNILNKKCPLFYAF